jgi:hypothetical protein
VICLSNGTNVILGFVGEFGSMLQDYKRKKCYISIQNFKTYCGKFGRSISRKILVKCFRIIREKNITSPFKTLKH